MAICMCDQKNKHIIAMLKTSNFSCKQIRKILLYVLKCLMAICTLLCELESETFFFFYKTVFESNQN